MSLHTAKQSVKGECEFCETKDVMLHLQHGDMMCSDCIAHENAVVPSTAIGEVNKVWTNAVKVVAEVQTKSDIFKADTVDMMQVRAAIENDANIPADQKEFAYTKYCHDQMQSFQRAAFEQRQTLLQTEEKARNWQIEVQTLIGKLRPEHREHFKSLNINYQPTPVAKPKPVKPKSTGTTESAAKIAQAAFQAAKKYDVDSSGVRMIMKSKGLNAEDAAKELARIMGKLT